MSLNLKAERDKEDMIENVRAVLGNDIDESDIPAIMRAEPDFYDIEMEKELMENSELKEPKSVAWNKRVDEAFNK